MQILNESCYKKEQYMRVPTEIAKDLYFYVEWAGKLECKNDFYIRRNRLNSYLLLYTTGGSGTLHYEKSTYRITKGNVVLLDCNVDQEYFTESAPWTFQYIHFCGNLSDRYCRLIHQLYHAPVFISNIPDLGKLFDRVIAGTASAADEVTVSDHLYRLLAALIAHCEDKQQSFRAGKAMDYISDNYMENIDVQTIADACGFSRSYFSVQFKDATGLSPHEYLVQCRISAAKQMLTNTTTSISRIADACGFASSSAFIRAFKKQVGLSPLAYKKQLLTDTMSG